MFIYKFKSLRQHSFLLEMKSHPRSGHTQFPTYMWKERIFLTCLDVMLTYDIIWVSWLGKCVLRTRSPVWNQEMLKYVMIFESKWQFDVFLFQVNVVELLKYHCVFHLKSIWKSIEFVMPLFGHLYVQMNYVKNIHEFSMEFDMLTLELKYLKNLKSIGFMQNG